MPNIGRILILPKGTYDATATYEMLDLVSYNDSSWLAKKTVLGIEPSAENSEYWQHMFNVSAKDVETLKTDVETLETDVKTLKKDVATQKDDAAKLKTDVETLKTDKISVVYQVHSNTSDYFCESYKYSDGRMVINMMFVASVTLDRTSGSLYYGEIAAKNFPIAFVRKPSVDYTCEAGETNAFVWGKDVATKEATAPLYIARGSIATGTRNMRIVAKADGRWK